MDGSTIRTKRFRGASYRPCEASQAIMLEPLTVIVPVPPPEVPTEARKVKRNQDESGDPPEPT